MAINFPASPSVNDTFTAGSITYKWDGAKWIGLGVTPADRLVEGSNSLEITAGNDLVWTGDNIGINDTSPDNKLHITTTSSSAYSTNTTNTSNLTNALLKLQNLDGSDGTGVNNYVGIQFSVANGATSTAQLQYVRTGDNAGKFEFKARNTSSNYPNIMTLLSSGDVGIGDNTPDNTLSIKGIGSFDGDENSFYFGSNFTGTGQNYIGSSKHAQRFFLNNASANGYFSYSNTGSAGTAGDAITWKERFRITGDGDLIINNNLTPTHSTEAGSIFLTIPSEQSANPSRGICWAPTSDTHYVKLEPTVIDGLVVNGYSGVAFATGSRSNSTWAEQARITTNGLAFSSGKGIDFSANTNATGMTSELLDDYEEGNYSPAWLNATGVNYISQNGQYVRVGSMVYVWGEFQFSTFTSFPNGWDQITLPFAGTRIGGQTNSLSNNWWAVTSGGTGQVSGHLNFGPLGHPGEGNAAGFTNTFLTGNNGMGNASIGSIFTSSATTKTIRFHMCYTAQ